MRSQLHPRSFADLPDIATTSFALSFPSLDRDALQETLRSDLENVAYGPQSDVSFINDLTLAVNQTSASFYTMFDITPANAEKKIRSWLASRPLGELSHDLELALGDDILGDAATFMKAVGVLPITLRIVLENQSGCGAFGKLAGVESPLLPKINEIVSKLSYDASYLFHCDEDMVNQIKQYVGAPTIAIDSDEIAEGAHFINWYEIFFHPEKSLATQVEELLNENDRVALQQVGRELEIKIASYQIHLPGLLLPGSHPYSFLSGRSHLYFGAQDKIEQQLGTTRPKGLLHAKPAIWADQPNAKRLLVLMDSPVSIELKDLI